VDPLNPKLDNVVIDRGDQVAADAEAIRLLRQRMPVLAFVNNHLGHLADARAAPQVDLEEAVLGGDEALGKEQVVGILRVDVGDAPAVAQDLDRLLQAGDLDLPPSWAKTAVAF